jgi:hypothetical protein
MQRNRLLIIAVVVVVFIAAGAYLALRGLGGTGKPVTLALSVTGTTMSPTATPTVDQNDMVTMTVTTDQAEEIHLHGYDIHFEIPGPGQSVTHTFKADKSGRFDMEIEASSTGVGTFVVNPR